MNPTLSSHPLSNAVSRAGAGRRAALLVALLAFAVNAGLAWWLFRADAFVDFNRLFETDPNVRLGEIASGWSSGGELHWRLPQSLHALMPYLFSLPIRALAIVLHALGLGASQEIVRNHLGLLVMPLANGASAAMLSLMFSRLGAAGWRLVAINALTLATFSNTVFGSVPDHFAMTRCVAMALLLLALVEVSGPPQRHRWTWRLLSLLAAGVTVTNAAFVATTRFVVALGHGSSWLAAARRALGLAIAGMLLAIVIGSSLGILRYGTPAPAAGHLAKWLTLPSPQRISAVLGAVGESFVPLALVDEPVHFKEHVWPTIVLASTLEIRAESLALAAAVLALTFWGAVRLARAGPAGRWLMAAAALQFAGILLFFIWGDTPFLYSPHWLPGQEVMLGGLLLASGRSDDRGAAAAALGLLLASAVATLVAWRFIVLAVLAPVA